MPATTVLVVALSVLVVFNLLLTFGVIRRLRAQSELLGRTGAVRARSGILEAGKRVADFQAQTVGGADVSRANLAEMNLFAFFTPTCPACVEQLPLFETAVGAERLGTARPLAVVVAPASEAAQLVERLSPVVDVVVEQLGGAVSTAFGVRSFPAFGLVDSSGVLNVATHAVSDLPVMARG